MKDRRKVRYSQELRILYEDEAVVAIDKPPGLPAVPIKEASTPSALTLLQAKLAKKKQRALIVHRIDRFTSGVMLFAKNERMKEKLVEQFLAHTPVREYLAVVRGRLAEREGKLVHYFRREGIYQKLSNKGDARAARAELSYKLERSLRQAAIVRVSLVTGLQNQIRAQFSAIGNPVVGDRKYHPAEAAERKIARVALHAARLEFIHPVTGEPLSIECPLPPDFQSLVASLTPSRKPQRRK